MSTSSRSVPSPLSLLDGLGQALRWLRERQSRKQYRVADDAGITKGMLSAYETGRQRPSLETLEKLLATLSCDLSDLHNALQIVNGRPERLRGWYERPLAPLPPLPPLPMTAGSAPSLHSRQLPDPLPSFVAEGLPPGGTHLQDSSAPLAPRTPAAPREGTADLPSWLPAALAGISGPGGPTGGIAGLSPAGAPSGMRRLAPEEELALDQMLTAFQGLIRYWHDALASFLPHLSELAANTPSPIPRRETGGTGATAAGTPPADRPAPRRRRSPGEGGRPDSRSDPESAE